MGKNKILLYSGINGLSASQKESFIDYVEKTELEDNVSILKKIIADLYREFLPTVEEKVIFLENEIEKLGPKKRWNKVSLAGQLFNNLKKVKSKIKSIKNWNIENQDPQHILNITDIFAEIEKIESKIPQKIIQITNKTSENTTKIIDRENKNHKENQKKEDQEKIMLKKIEDNIVHKVSKIFNRLNTLYNFFWEEKNSPNPNTKRIQEIRDEKDKLIHDVTDFVEGTEFENNNFNNLLANLSKFFNSFEDKKISKKDADSLKKIEDSSEKTEEIIQNSENINFELPEKYENFFKKIFDEIDYTISSTKNPKNLNSKWDWGFAVKIARPFFRGIYNLIKDKKINLESISWQELVLSYETYISDNDKSRKTLLQILKKYDEKGDFIQIFANFLPAIKEFSETNFYKKDKYDNLLNVYEKIKIILDNFNE